MSNKIIENCPACGKSLYISQLKCSSCGIEINGDFKIRNSLNLSEEELELLKLFVKCEGNFTKMQKETYLSNNAIKSKLKRISVALGNEEFNEYEGLEKYLEPGDYEDQLTASGEIIRKLNECGGSAVCQMLRGEPIMIWQTKEGVRNSNYPELICRWEVFEAILNKSIELGGKMYRGDSAAHNGAKIGDKGLEEDTIDGFISLKFYGKQKGETTLRRSTYYSSIMAWAGICLNKKSDGNGGYIQLNDMWLN